MRIPPCKLRFEPPRAWTHIADAYAIALILLAVTGLFVLNGSLGITGSGGWFIAAGALVPIGYWFVYLRQG